MPPRKFFNTVCYVDGCDKPVKKSGLCNAHSLRMWRHGSPPGGSTGKGEARAFMLKSMSYDGEECILWPYNRTRGYAVIAIDRIMKYVSRIICENRHGPPPSPKHEAAHSCGKGHLGCITPKHLRWATRKENAADAMVHGTTNKGRKLSKGKLPLEVRLLMLERIKSGGKIADIAREFSVTHTAVSYHKRRMPNVPN